MLIDWRRDDGSLTYGDTTIPCVCEIRNEINGLRKLSEPVVYTERQDGSRGVPYFPRKFPLGTWKVLAVIPKADPYMSPFFISTDAHQTIDEWEEVAAHYYRATGKRSEDYGYGLHCSKSRTTLGCGKIMREADLRDLIADIDAAWMRGETVTLIVS